MMRTLFGKGQLGPNAWEEVVDDFIPSVASEKKVEETGTLLHLVELRLV